jgi:8-oxo-dGTP diphosphatase
LPSEYAILNSGKGVNLLSNLNTILDSGVTLIQARIKTLNAKLVSQFLEQALPLCRQKGAYLLINSAVDHVGQTNIDGIHLTSKDLLASKQRPVEYQWVAASCHNLKELKHAEKIEVDFVVLAPVLATTTHPDVDPIGWKKFEQLTNETNRPVFALGGLQKKDKKTAQQAGAQGISGISMFLM